MRQRPIEESRKRSIARCVDVTFAPRNSASSSATLGEALVSDLEQAVAGAGAAHGLDVAPPRPRAAPRVAHLRELLAPLRLDPEARLRPVREPRVVAAFCAGVEPAALEQRAHDVAAVAQRVHRERLRIGLQRSAEHVRGLGRLLDAAQSPREPDAPDPLEDRPQLGRRRPFGKRRLPRRHLAEVDEAGQAADRAADERRPGARAADDEDEPLLPAEPRPLHERALRDPHSGGAVVEQRAHNASGSESGTMPSPCRSVSISRCASREQRRELVDLVARHLDRHAHRRAGRGGQRHGLDVVRGESRHVEILVPREPAPGLEPLCCGAEPLGEDTGVVTGHADRRVAAAQPDRRRPARRSRLRGRHAARPQPRTTR